MPLEMKDIVELAKTRGFVYPGSEIYGGLANAWDYGPYGSLLKENIKRAWIRQFVQRRSDMTLIESAILMNPKVWVASGHVGGFSDPLIDCKSCRTRHRADKLIEADFARQSIDRVADGMGKEGMEAYLRDHHIKCPDCGASDFTEIRAFNLMFHTYQGVTEDTSSLVYLRPETAQGMFVDFAQVLRTSRRKIPFGIGQVGKSFRNEITPGNFIFRTREFEQMEIEYFCEPESVAPGRHLEIHAEWKNACMSFLTDVLRIRPETLRFRDHEKEELSHYSAATTDIEYLFPFGWGELWGIADRTDFDLKAHMRDSGQDLSYFDPVTNQKYIPYVIEPAIGLTRLFLVNFINAYDRQVTPEGERTVMRFPAYLAPIKVGIMPIVKRLAPEAMRVYDLVSQEFQAEYDDAGAVGKRYYRFDEIGVPYCITVDSEHYDAGTVTVRDRDTGTQDVVALSGLRDYLRERCAFPE